MTARVEKRKDRRAEPDIELGGIDPMSVLAAKVQLPLCNSVGCTRAKGHDEDTGTKHVVTVGGAITAIWED